MFTSLSASATPLPAAFEVLRSGLLNQRVITQRHLSAVGHLVRSAGAQAQTGLTGSAADRVIAQQALALTTLTDSFVGMARVLSDLHTRAASELLQWWETQLRAVAPWDIETVVGAGSEPLAEPSPAEAEPPAVTAAPVTSLPPRAAAKKPATRKTTGRKPSAKTAAETTPVAKKATIKKAATKKTAARKTTTARASAPRTRKA